MLNSKISCSIKMQIFMKLRKLWSFGKDIRTTKDIFISKLQIAKNHLKLDVSENSKGNVMLVKVH